MPGHLCDAQGERAAGGGGSRRRAGTTQHGGLRDIQRARRHDHFQTLVATMQIEAGGATASGQHGGGEHRRDGLHGGWLGAGGQLTIVGQMLTWAKGDLGRIVGWLDRPTIDAILASLGQELLQRQAGRLGLWPGGLGVKDHMDGTPAANDTGEQQETEQPK